jgi:hypothetical protein
MNELFLKARRNLMIISFIILFISFAGIELKNNITILGTKFNINDPIVVYIIIWLMMPYFYIRYFQEYVNLSYDNKLNWEISNYWNSNEKSFSIDFSLIGIVFLIWNTIKYSLNVLLNLIEFIFDSIINRNFLYSFSPFIFALTIYILSFNSPFAKTKYPLVIKKAHSFNNALLKKTYIPVVNYIDYSNFKIKKEINSYYKIIFSDDLFKLDKKIHNNREKIDYIEPINRFSI